jgi:hypothetical protein
MFGNLDKAVKAPCKPNLEAARCMLYCMENLQNLIQGAANFMRAGWVALRGGAALAQRRQHC